MAAISHREKHGTFTGGILTANNYNGPLFQEIENYLLSMPSQTVTGAQPDAADFLYFHDITDSRIKRIRYDEIMPTSTPVSTENFEITGAGTQLLFTAISGTAVIRVKSISVNVIADTTATVRLLSGTTEISKYTLNKEQTPGYVWPLVPYDDNFYRECNAGENLSIELVTSTGTDVVQGDVSIIQV